LGFNAVNDWIGVPMQLIAPWLEEAKPQDAAFTALGETIARLGSAGLDVRFVTGAYACPLPSDVHYLSLRGEGPRRGLMAWLALLVAGETVERALLERGWPEGAQLVARLEQCRLVTGVGADRVTMRACLQPLGLRTQGGRPWLLSDRLQAKGEAVSAPDLSAWNVIGCLPSGIFGSSVLDVGAGAGAVALHLALAGADVTATDLHEPALRLFARNLLLNGLTAEQYVADVFNGLPDRRYDLVVFNAPLLVDSTIGGDGATWYTAASQGEGIALQFVEELDRVLEEDGEALLHAQYTPALVEALRPWETTSLLFASAADGTPFGLHRIVRGEGGARVLRTPLGKALPHLRRALLLATAPARDAPLCPAPWLELVVRRSLARIATTERSFGGAPIDEGTEACLVDFADNPRPAESELDFSLVKKGWLVDAQLAT
jgi:SAM-dependent methyltransferase